MEKNSLRKYPMKIKDATWQQFAFDVTLEDNSLPPHTVFEIRDKEGTIVDEHRNLTDMTKDLPQHLHLAQGYAFRLYSNYYPIRMTLLAKKENYIKSRSKARRLLYKK